MPVALDEFRNHLIASRLMSEGDIETFLSTLPADKRPQDGEVFAKLLVHRKKLTLFQARAIYQGRPEGLVLGDYTILDKIGAGGMGQVFKAMHHRMERLVAIKVLPPELLRLPDSVQRFEREVKAAAKLSHPNIVTAYDARNDRGTHYLVMEYVEGIDLANLVFKKGPLPVETAVDYLLQAASGLQHAHAQGVIHRDIKPANILLDNRGTIKILDMGLARLHEDTAGTISVASGLTRAGRIMGTVDYMAPEQAVDSSTADELSDIYSLGCTLYYLLMKRSLYEGKTPLAQVVAHRESPLPLLRNLRPDVPVFVEAAFQQMVAKDPRDRYQSMADVIAGLTTARETAPASYTRSEGLLPRNVIAEILGE